MVRNLAHAGRRCIGGLLLCRHVDGVARTGADAARCRRPAGPSGRLDLIDGAVSFRPAASDTWALPVPNRVVTTGDRLWVDSVGHAEVEVGPNALRMAPETELDVVHLDDDMVQVRLPQGTIDVRIKEPIRA